MIKREKEENVDVPERCSHSVPSENKSNIFESHDEAAIPGLCIATSAEIRQVWDLSADNCSSKCCRKW